MTVRCEGDSRAMEQLGEKQDFESELSRLGYTHEAFLLHVRRVSTLGGATTWSVNYAVCVTNSANNIQNIYWGGPGKNWVSEFAADVARGLYGLPDDAVPARRPLQKVERPRIVSGGVRRR